MKKIVFFDLDGTLLDHNKRLPRSAKQAVAELKKRDHEVAIATGRAPFMFDDLRRELDIKTFVSLTGQYVVLNGKVIYTNPLSKDALQSLTDFASLSNHPLVYMSHDDMKANVPYHEDIIEAVNTLKVEKFPTYNPHYFNEVEIYQSLLFCKEGEETVYGREMGKFDFIRWHRVSVDVLPAGASKAHGISLIADNLGIEEENVFVFGDGLNDVDMLKTIKNSVAMGNGHELAKKAARYITESVDRDGILYGLKIVGLLE